MQDEFIKLLHPVKQKVNQVLLSIQTKVAQKILNLIFRGHVETLQVSNTDKLISSLLPPSERMARKNRF